MIDPMDILKKEMLNKKNWAVLGATDKKERFGYKILKKLNELNYNVVGINPKYKSIDSIEIVSNLKSSPFEIDCVNFIVAPNISFDILDEVAECGIKNVWFQPGSFDEDVIKKAESLKLNIVYFNCLYVALEEIY